MNFRRLVATILLTAATVVLTATPAAAHAELIGSTPAQGAAVAAPTEVRLTFSEPVTPAPNAVEVTGPAGARWVVGTPTVAGADVTVPVEASGPAGAYTLAYRVVSADGDPVMGKVSFTLTAAATPSTPSSTPPSSTAEPAPESETSAAPVVDGAQSDPEDESGLPAWVWILGGVLLVAAGTAAALRLTRSAGTTPRAPAGL